MPRLAVILALSILAAFAEGAADGRRGTALLETSDLDGAITAFQDGLTATENRPGPIRARLFNNLGLAHYAREAFGEAGTNFDEALALAQTADARARYAFNAGTAFARGDSLDAARSRLRRALIIQPDFPEARHNFEWVQRRLQQDEQSPSGEPPPPPEPSDYAQRLKEQADALVASRRYRDALDLLNDGLTRDSTVAAYNDMMQRLDAVAALEDTP